MVYFNVVCYVTIGYMSKKESKTQIVQEEKKVMY